MNNTDHKALAFYAVRSGNLDLLEILLGSSISFEKERKRGLNADIVTLYTKCQLLEFTKIMAQLEIKHLAKFRSLLNKDADKADVFNNFNNNLDQAIKALIIKCLNIERRNIEQYPSGHFNASDPFFPLAVEADPTTLLPETMRDFFKAWPGLMSDEHSRYHFKFNSEIVEALCQLWKARFERQVSTYVVKINDASQIEPRIADLEALIKYSELGIKEVSERMQPLKEEVGLLCEHYSERRRRIGEIFQLIANDPSILPMAYREHAGDLENFLDGVVIPLNATDDRGNTLLHAAVEARQFRIVKLLLDRHADTKTKNHEQKTALDILGDSEDALILLADMMIRRADSQYYKEVKRCFETYKVSYKKLEKSIKRAFHNKSRFKQRGESLVQLEALIEEAGNSPSDDYLARALLRESRMAKRGIFGRSKLFDPLKRATEKFFEEEGYGVSSDEVLELTQRASIDVVRSQFAMAELASTLAEKDATIDKLQGERDLFRELNSGLSVRNNVLTETCKVQGKSLEERDREIEHRDETIKHKDEKIDRVLAECAELKTRHDHVLSEWAELQAKHDRVLSENVEFKDMARKLSLQFQTLRSDVLQLNVQPSEIQVPSVADPLSTVEQPEKILLGKSQDIFLSTPVIPRQSKLSESGETLRESAPSELTRGQYGTE